MPGIDTNTLFLAQLNGADAATSTADASQYGRTITLSNAELDTAIKKFGSAALKFNTASGKMTVASSAAFNFGTGDFTIDLQFYVPGGDHQIIISSGGETDWINWYFQTSQFGVRLETSSDTFSHSMTLATWNHIALERYSGTIYVYVNGTKLANTPANSSNISTAGTVQFGQSDAPYIGTRTDAAIDEVRISNVARYQGTNFTAPTAEYSGGTQLATIGRRPMRGVMRGVYR